MKTPVKMRSIFLYFICHPLNDLVPSATQITLNFGNDTPASAMSGAFDGNSQHTSRHILVVRERLDSKLELSNLSSTALYYPLANFHDSDWYA